MRGGSAARFGTAQDNAGQCVGGGHAALSGHALLTADKHQQQQHAAAFCSIPQRQILGAVGGGFEACRSMPQCAAACRSEPKFSHGGFFFHNMSNV